MGSNLYSDPGVIFSDPPIGPIRPSGGTGVMSLRDGVSLLSNQTVVLDESGEITKLINV